MIEVQQRPLRALQQHPLTLLQQVLHHLFGGTDHWPQPLSPPAAKFQYLVGVHWLAAVHAGDDPILHFHGGLNPVRQLLGGIQQVAHADAVAGCLVHVGRADALSGGANGAPAPGLLLQLVQQDVIGHDDVGAVADEQKAGVDALLLQAGDLPQQHFGIDDHAVADDAGDAGPADAGGNQVQLELAALVHYRMSGVVAAGVAHDAIGLAGKVVNNFALAFVAPLSPDYGVSRHCPVLPDSLESKPKNRPRRLLPAAARPSWAMAFVG